MQPLMMSMMGTRVATVLVVVVQCGDCVYSSCALFCHQYQHGETPLHDAVSGEVVEVLVSHGASVDVKDKV